MRSQLTSFLTSSSSFSQSVRRISTAILNSLDTICLEGLLFHGYHGVYPEERSLGQKFAVDASLFCRLQKAGRSDDLDDTVNYAEVYQKIRRIIEGPPHNLVESVAEEIASDILSSYTKIVAVRVKITKPHVAVPGPLKSFGIEILRRKEDVDK